MTLDLEGVCTEFDSFALGPVSTSFDAGVTVVLGPSGGGKSSLLSLIAGFETPTSGTISLDGERIDHRPPEERGVGVVFQHYALFPHLDVAGNLAFGAAPESDVEATCDLLEITDLLDRAPETLSGGEKQRVALARTLVSDPDVLLLDEPLASLDAPIRRRLRLDLRDILSDLDIPVVYVTHDKDEAAVVGDRLCILFDGQIVQEGGVESVFDAPATPAVADFVGMENVYPGTVVDTDGDETAVRVGSATLWTTDSPDTSQVTVAVHPAAVDLTRELRDSVSGEGSSALRCRVDRVVSRHTDAAVVLSCEGLGRLTAGVDRQTARALTEGEECLATVSSANVHTMPADADDRPDHLQWHSDAPVPPQRQ